MSELEALIGLSAVKEEIQRLMRFLNVQQARKTQGLHASTQTLHFVFTGNPGTGKTTVARTLSKILCGFGLLRTSKLVECDQSRLVAGYVGQTAIKTNEVIDSALDGVLFIDEAYALLPQNEQASFGKEAIDTLLKRMEDERARLVVIAAGYTEPMQRFLNSNPGLKSRFTRFIHFEDYQPPDLCRIFEKFCLDQQYDLSTSARAYLCLLFTLAYNRRDEQFGNGRFVRNVFEEATNRHADRIGASMGVELDKSALTTLDRMDVPFDMRGLSGFDPDCADFTAARWGCECPVCGKKGHGGLKQLGQVVVCTCGQRLQFPWWGLVAETVRGVPLDLLATMETWDVKGTLVLKESQDSHSSMADFVAPEDVDRKDDEEHPRKSDSKIQEQNRGRESHTKHETVDRQSQEEVPEEKTQGDTIRKNECEPVFIACPSCEKPVEVTPKDWFKKVRCINPKFRVYIRPLPIPGTSVILKPRRS